MLLQTKQWHQLQKEADNGEYTKRMRKESKCCWKNDFKQSEIHSINLLKKYSYVRSTKWGVNSCLTALFYTKIKSSFILQVFRTSVVLNFFSFKQKLKGKAARHQSKSGLRNTSCHSTWSTLKQGLQKEAHLLRKN